MDLQTSMKVASWRIIDRMDTKRLVGPCILAATTVVAAQIPVNQEPRHRVMFENAQLRILNVLVPAADTTLDHRHEFDVATISMASGATTRVQTTGNPWGAVRPSRALGDPSVTEYAGKPGSHRIENVGTTAYRLFAVENLRTSGWSTAPPASGLATTLRTDARSFRIYDVNLARDTSQTSHTHEAPTIAILISGTVMSDGPDAKAKENAPAPVGLKQLTELGHWVLVPRGDRHHLVRLGTADARIVEVEVR